MRMTARHFPERDRGIDRSGCAMGLSTEERHSYLRAALSKLDQAALATVDASPGPWWGFNGVNTLVLSADRVWLAASRLTRPPALLDFELADVEVVDSRERRAIARRGGGRVTVFRLRLGKQVHRFAAEDSGTASRFLDSLGERLAASA
jgi:hypothetical protein